MEKINLTLEQMDALKELGNIGAGNAATALNQLLGRKVYIDTPKLKFLNIADTVTSDFISEPNEVGIALALRILGVLKGGMLVMFSQKSACLMADILMNRPISATQLLTLLDISAVTESSHILCSSYLSAVGEFLGLYQLIPSMPHAAMDRMDRLGSIFIKKFIGDDISYIIPIENQMVIEDVKINMLVVFLLENESVMKILKIMKMAGL